MKLVYFGKFNYYWSNDTQNANINNSAIGAPKIKCATRVNYKIEVFRVIDQSATCDLRQHSTRAIIFYEPKSKLCANRMRDPENLELLPMKSTIKLVCSPHFDYDRAVSRNTNSFMYKKCLIEFIDEKP